MTWIVQLMIPHQCGENWWCNPAILCDFDNNVCAPEVYRNTGAIYHHYLTPALVGKNTKFNKSIWRLTMFWLQIWVSHIFCAKNKVLSNPWSIYPFNIVGLCPSLMNVFCFQVCFSPTETYLNRIYLSSRGGECI